MKEKFNSEHSEPIEHTETKKWINKIKNILLIIGILLIVAMLLLFAILWVTETGTPTTANGSSNIKQELLFGGTSTLLFGILFFSFGSIVYGAGIKNFKPIGVIVEFITLLIGIILINSIPGLIIGLLLLLVVISKLVFNFTDFKNFYINMFDKNKNKNNNVELESINEQ